MAPFLWTAYADFTRRGEAVFLINTWVSVVAACLLPNLTGLLPMAAAVLVFATFRTTLIPLANSMVFRALAGRHQGFAAIRLWGTVGYILTAVCAGFVVDRLGLRVAMHGIALAATACGLVAWLGRSRGQVGLPPAGLRAFMGILRDREFALLLVAAALARVSFGPYTTFFTIHLERLGLSGAFAGTAWALAAASELVVMLCWKPLSALASARTWLTVALGSHALRWLLSIPARDPALVLLIQLIHAFNFGVFYLAAVQMVDVLVPDGLRGTAQGIFASVVFGLGGLLGNTLSGFLYEPLGMAWLYAAAAVLAAGATVLYWTGTRPGVGGRRLGAGPIPGGTAR